MTGLITGKPGSYTGQARTGEPFVATSTLARFDQLIADQDLPRCWLFHGEPWDSSVGALTNVYLSSGAAVPLFDGELWRARLKTVFEFETSLGGVADPFALKKGGRAEIATGDNDSGMEALRNYYWDGRNVTAYMGDPATAFSEFGVVLSAQVQDVSWNESVFRAVLRDSDYVFRNPVQTVKFTSGDLNNSDMPLVFGQVFNIEPRLRDALNYIYQVHDRRVQAINKVFDRGNVLTFAANFDTYAQLLAWTPVAGQYATCLDLAMFRLAARPVGPVTCDVEGDAAGGYVSTCASLIRRIAEYKGGPDAPAFDHAAFEAINDSRPWVGGIYIDGVDATPVQEIIGQLAASLGAWTGVKADGKLTAGLFQIGASALTIDVTDYVRLEAIETPAPAWQVRAGYAKSWLVQELEAIDSSVGPGSITATELAAGAVTAPALGAGAVTAPAIGAGAVGTAALASSAVLTANLGANAATGHVISEDATTRSVTVVVATEASLGGATTISFTAPSTIDDSGSGFVAAGFVAGQTVQVVGSSLNDGIYTLATVAAGALTVNQTSIATEAAGATMRVWQITAYNNATATVITSLASVSINATTDIARFDFNLRINVSNLMSAAPQSAAGVNSDAIHVAIYDLTTATVLYQETISTNIMVSTGFTLASDGTMPLPVVSKAVTGLSVGNHTIECRVQPVDQHGAGAPRLTMLVTNSSSLATVFKR